MSHICRRHALALIGLGGVGLTLGGCFEPETGPVEIAWDRDSCELCKMIISDQRFAAQVRGGPKHKAYKFDDIGCAVNWLNEKPWAGDPKTEIWVAERTSKRAAMTWLNAREARYVPDQITPMNYGFGAVKPDAPEAEGRSIGFERMTDIILKNAPNHICRPSRPKASG